MSQSACLVRTVALMLFSLAFPIASSSAQSAAAPPATPLEPITAILDAFHTHAVVALGEGVHGNEQSHAFRLSLIRHSRFAATVNDIVVEFGSARYQDLMDRFVRGEDVPGALLRRAWQDTTNLSPIWDIPIYEEFYRAVRVVNASLPKDRQIRILLGGPPIDWDNVRTAEDLTKAIPPGNHHPARLIQREVLAKKRRALVIYGDMHFRRQRDASRSPDESLVRLLESSGSGKVFSIWTNTLTELSDVQPNVASWPVPSLAIVAGTLLGATPFDTYASEASAFMPAPGQQTAAPPAKPPAPTLRMEEQFDAILYVGPVSALTKSEISPALCADADYVKMRARRMAFMPGPAGPQHPAERLRQFCARQVAK